ncbi:MAG: hypothetical protein ACRESK_05920 [Gammaproteobacteria bacterium]
MSFVHILIAVAIGVVVAFFHSLALQVATRLMINVSVTYQRALTIIVIEYTVVFFVAMILFLALENQPLTVVSGSLAYLFTGAALMDIWITAQGGQRLGIGNGVLIQAIQIPILVPLVIIAWLLYDMIV